jgi:hypothetical protein
MVLPTPDNAAYCMHMLLPVLHACPVQVWEVQWGRSGFMGCKKVMDLKGHSSQVGQQDVGDARGDSMWLFAWKRGGPEAGGGLKAFFSGRGSSY